MFQAQQPALRPAFVAYTVKSPPLIFWCLRVIIAHELEAESETKFGGKIEVDENYFGGKRKGKRGWGTAGKVPNIWLT